MDNRHPDTTSPPPEQPLPFATVTEPRRPSTHQGFCPPAGTESQPGASKTLMDFVRAARLPAPQVEVGDVDVAGPPDLPKPTPANPLARLLPVAMVVATVGMMALYFTSPMGVA